MTQQNQSAKAKLIRLQSLLSSQTKSEITVFYLQQLLTFFRDADIKNQNVMKNQVYEELRDTVKTIFAYLQKVKPPHTQITSTIQQLIKQLLLAISKFCSQFYCTYHPVGCGEMIKQFLASECRLFVPDFGAGAISISNQLAEHKPQAPEEDIKKNWIWAKYSSFKTLFFCDCIETIMLNLCKFQQKFSEMHLTVIGQYLRLLYYMDDYLISDKIINLCVKHVYVLEILFINPSKQIMKDANKQKLEEIIQYLTKLLRNYKIQSLKKKNQLLGALLGLSMLKMNSIQKKIVGCKIVSKFSYQMLYRNSSYITQTSFSQWVVSQGFFQLVFQDNCQISLIKASEDTFKLLVKRGQLTKQQFQRFFQILQKAQPELRKAMFRLIDPFRVDYHQIQAMLQIFKNIRGAQFYDDQYFYFLEGLSRYSTQIQLTNMLGIVQHIISANYNKFQSYLTKRRSVEAYSYIFERLITYKDPLQRIDSYIRVATDFITQPTQNKLIMLKTLFQNLTQHKMDRSMQQTLCDKIIIELKFIQKSFNLINEHKFRDDLVTTIKIILKKYCIRFNRQPFTQKSLIQSVNFPEIFQQMLKLTNNEQQQQLQSLFNELASLSALQQFSFSCIKSVFVKLNCKNLRAIKKQYTDIIGTYVTYFNPQSFIGLDTLKYLIFNSKKQSMRKGACQLLVQVYTNLADDFREEGQIYLIEFMKNIILVLQHKLKSFYQGTQQIISVKGTLELIQDLLLNTQYFGVGSLKAHNSLIPTSTVSLKVYNNSTYGDDVLKIFQKKFPSNKTLFDVILQVSKQFKIGPLDMCLQFPNSSVIKYNGLTLEQLKLNKQQLNAIKLPQSRLKKQQLLIDGQLSAQAKKVFTDMFNKYAPSGKMTTKQCAQYIEGVTLSFCPTFDIRINTLFAQYDSDKDNILVLQDFLKFYKDCVLDPQKAQVVDKNLGNLHYRRDLKLFDEELTSLNQQVLFRHHIWKNKQIYQYLFKLAHHQDPQLSSLAQLLLLRLPTYPKVTESLTQTLNLKQKQPFQVQYLLTALQSQIANDQSTSSKLIKSNNHLAIFDYLSQLSLKEVKSQNQKNCLIICLHLLHSLLGLKKSSDNIIKQLPQLAFQLPKTTVFLKIIRESIKNSDSTLLQPAFALQLTQTQMPFDWIQEAAFNKDKDTRTITCGFLCLWALKYKNKDFNLFKIKISPTNNQQWFDLLTLVINIGMQKDHHDIFSSKITQIQNYSQSLQTNRFNPIIHGNLKIIRQLYNRLNQQQKTLLHKTLIHILPSLISNQNRQLVYHLTFKGYPLELLNILQQIVQVKIGKEAHPRNKFVGIKNLGCICYMNSILQQFFMLQQVHSLIMSLQPNCEEIQLNGIKFVDDFLYQLQQMYIHLEWSQKQYYDPTKFCMTIKDGQGKPISLTIQQDAHEFLNTAFDKIQAYSKKQEKQKILQRIFGGKTVTEIICQTCKNKIQVLQSFYHLTVQVKGMKTLKESFDKLILPQQISDYFCVNCDKKVEKITKQALIKESPQILIINLQRIVFDLETFLKVKVHTNFQFGQVLDLSNYFSSSTKPAPYNLKGVVIHSGTSEGGHYYSLIKEQGKWYKFNDQSVTQFNQNDLGRQAFGGQQHTDTMGDFTSSTNAYILIYQQAKKAQQCQNQQIKYVINEKQQQAVIIQNKEFQLQLQLYQPSFFSCLNSLFEKYTTQVHDKDILCKLYEIYLKIIQHMSINSDIKTQTINQIKDNFIKLSNLLPQKAIKILQIFDKKALGQIICNNNDVNIRQIYSKIIIKSLISLVEKENGQISERTQQIILYIFGLLQDDIVIKNIYKSFQYFQVWKQLVTNQSIRKLMLHNNYIVKLLDLLMGGDSIHSTKEKKRVDFSVSEAIPIVPVIITLMQYKLNFLGLRFNKLQHNTYYQLTQNEKKIFNDPNFYRKMMKNKLDMGLLNPIITLLSYQDEKYSKFIIEVLLKAMNNNDEIQDKNIVFVNLKSYFLIDDEFCLERLKWGLGIYQLDSIAFNDHQFGMMTSSQSKVYSYVSSLFFVKQQKFMPMLSTLFDKRKYFNSFSAHGILMLLQLLNESQKALQYILVLPGPCYIHKTYIDWIQTYTFKIKSQEHYGLPYQKGILWQKLNKLIEGYKQRAKISHLFMQLPVNKKVIGKNSKVILKDSVAHTDYSIDMWAHETYVILNRPYGMGNFELPDQQFSFATTAEPGRSKYFIKCLQMPMHGAQIQVQKQFTVLTFCIKSKIILTLQFKIPGFQHKIYLKVGQSVIYCPYKQSSNIQDVLEIIEGEKVIQVQPQIKIQQIPTVSTASAYAGFTPPDSGYNSTMDFDYHFLQVNCKVCTYLNAGRQTCQVCGSDLFK